MSSPDIVVRVGRKPGAELRWCIRALAEHLPGRIVTAGVRVPWLSCEHIDVDQPHGKGPGAYAVLHAILTTGWLTPDVIISDDDMFPLQTFATLPAYHRGPLADVDPGTRRAGWTDTLALVGPDAPCRDLHTPGLINRAGLATRLDNLHCDRSRIWWRTLAGGGDTLTADAKIRDTTSLPSGDWVSTCPTSWSGNAGAWLRDRYREVSPWETDATAALDVSA